MSKVSVVKGLTLKSFLCVSLLYLGSHSVLASGIGAVNSSARLSSAVSPNISPLREMQDTPHLLILAEPESINFELDGIGLVEVEVDFRQQEGGSRRLIKGRLRQGDVLLPYSAVTLIQSDLGLTGSLRTLEHSWLVTAGASGVRLVGENETVAAVESTYIEPVFLPIAVRAVQNLVATAILESNYHEWQAEKIYAGGELVSYQGQLYRASWWHHSQQPQQAGRSPWQQVGS